MNILLTISGMTAQWLLKIAHEYKEYFSEGDFLYIEANLNEFVLSVEEYVQRTKEKVVEISTLIYLIRETLEQISLREADIETSSGA